MEKRQNQNNITFIFEMVKMTKYFVTINTNGELFMDISYVISDTE